MYKSSHIHDIFIVRKKYVWWYFQICFWIRINVHIHWFVLKGLKFMLEVYYYSYIIQEEANVTTSNFTMV